MAMEFDLAIVGGGPAGLMAAVRAAARGRRVVLLEKNRRPGVKILMAGGTRCNLTHNTDARGIVAAFGPSGRFLHSALAALGPREVVEFFAARGVPTYVEEGGKVFPRSDRSADVLEALLAAARENGATLAGNEAVQRIDATEEGFHISTNNRRWTTRKVLIATGGCSYPACGTTGDGYELAQAFGHTIVPPRTAARAADDARGVGHESARAYDPRCRGARHQSRRSRSGRCKRAARHCCSPTSAFLAPRR